MCQPHGLTGLRTRARKRWFLPARIRRVVGAALGAAALDVDPEHACTLWAAGAAGATMLGAGVGGASVALGVLPILVVDGSTVDGGLREKV